MSVNSILTNSSALSALQSLNMTEQNLSITQNQVSSGLAVANSSQNAAYWSIGQQLNSDSGIVTATNSALAQSQAVFDTATSAINSVLTTISSIQSAITEATNPGADISTINTQLTQLSSQLTDAINGASFNGTNILNGTAAASMSFVSGFDASASGGTINTIAFTTSALSGGATVATTAQGPAITDKTTAAALTTLALTDTSTNTLAYGTNTVANSTTLTDTTGDTFAVSSMAADGTTTVTTYTGYDKNGNVESIAQAGADIASGTAAVPNGASFGVSVVTSAASTGGILTQNGTNLTSLGSGAGAVSAANASAMLSATAAAFAAVTNYAATIGSTQDRMTAAATLNSALTTNYALGVSSLVDADMNVASTRLQALQTQQQLGIQSLSIANQNSQLILKLFNG
jgi:flagellin